MVHTTSKFIKWLKKITLLYPYLNKILEEIKSSKTNIEWNHKTILKKNQVMIKHPRNKIKDKKDK